MNDNYYLLVKRNECIVQGTKSILPVSMHHFSISFLLVQFEVSNPIQETDYTFTTLLPFFLSSFDFSKYIDDSFVV